MRKGILVLLSLLVFVSLSASGAYASGKSSFTPPPASVAILGCAATSTTPVEYQVSFYSGPTTIAIKAGDDCSTDLATILNQGYRLEDVRVVNGVEVYTLVSGFAL